MTFVNMDMISVIDVNNPRAIIPPKEEKAKMINPANNTIDVYIMLFPVSMMLSLTATGMKKLFERISWRYLARKRIELSTEIPNVMLKMSAVLAF
jgi:hypothetical protein